MIKQIFLNFIVFVGFCHVLVAQQIATDSSLPLEALIQNTLGKSGCVEISNISSSVNGSVENISSFGRFTKESSSFPFQNGLVLSTGRIISGGNAMNTNILSEGTPAWGTDPDLETALGITKTMNATSVEFDFISAGNQIAFNYILASEEYIDTNPCLYSDGFAFLIKEAGTSNPYTNIALIPGTSTPVNTQTIRPQIVGHCPAENPTFFDGYNLGDTNYNGRTTVLTATSGIKPNVAYHIKLVIADQKDWLYDSAVFIEADSFNATVDLGPDLVTCASTVTLNSNIKQEEFTIYEWFRNGTLMQGATRPTLIVNQSGNYRVRLSVPLNTKTCIIEDDIVITLNVQQTLANIPDYELCDDSSNDGTETFDLSTRNDQILKSLPPSKYNITYHYSSEDAKAGNKAILAPTQSGPEPKSIYIRIEDIINGCLSYTGVKLIVNRLPQITPPAPLVICDTDGVHDGKTEIDLNQVNNDITNNPDYIVSYHYYPEDAQTGEYLIVSPFTNNNGNPDEIETLYVRVYDPNTGCFSLTTLDVQVLNIPKVAIDKPYINSCAPPGTGYESFDLMSIIGEVLEDLSGEAQGFYESYDDAEIGLNPIADSSNYQNIVQNFQVVFLKVVDPASGCFTIVPIELHTNISFTGLNTRDFNGCDDISEDGILDFDLNKVAETIINGYEGFEVTFFENQSDQQNDTGALDINVPYTVVSGSHTLYATVSNDDCDNFVTINLIVNPPIVLPTLNPDPYCDTDQDGIVAVLLESFNAYVSQGISHTSVQYYETEEDAFNNDQILEPYINIDNSQKIYVRVTNTLTSCYDIAPMIIQISKPPIFNEPKDIIICDNDLDGNYFVDLESKIPEIVTNNTGLTITFHRNYDSAINGDGLISNPNNFETSTTTISVRIEDNITGCFSIANLNIYINTLPQFPPISNFKNCEAVGTHVSSFYLFEKDEKILNGQTGKQVMYFETSDDAQMRVNPINKFEAYASGPKTIFVRVEATTDPDCFGTSLFELEVGSLPPFKTPEDIFICDDINNTGILTVDLTPKVSEIRSNYSGLEIVLYNSLDDAQGKINPITDLANYRNPANPQSIYARIENGTYCHSITTFSINVVQLPSVITSSTLSKCDTGTNSTMVFDLTEVEYEVLPVRPDNIIITYHESFLGAETDSEVIKNPKNYTNTSNPHTVYIKINNTVSNCYVNLPIKLKVNLPPVSNDFKNYTICATEDEKFNLSAIDTIITDETNIIVSYHLSSSDASNEIPISKDYTYITNNDKIYARLENVSTGCISYYEFHLVVSPLPLAFTPTSPATCDDDFDGLFLFDFSNQSKEILGSQTDSNFSVTFHKTQNAANTGANPLGNHYAAINGQIIYARVYNALTNCFSTTQFSTIVHPRPAIAIRDQTLCIDNLPLIVNADTKNPTDTYLWSNGETTPGIEIVNVGNYSVTITSSFNCQTTSEFEVIPSESATIDATETVDFSDPNNITITISGIGNYLYILDKGPSQESNIFEYVTLGYHTIRIIDLNGCAETIKEVVVIDAPKFITPNDDGFFDTWHISGIETLPGSVINIFDRYGKLITTLTSTSKGWDGTYNGRLLPSSDYWYLGKIKKNENTFEIKGHFALKL